jgi:UDP-N-acetylmuramate--alanine ligase
MSRELATRGVPISFNQDGEFLAERHALAPIDWFVHTAALPADHPELVRARELGIKTSKRDELLAHIITDKQLKLIAVAGTHGKTTTTGMLVWTLQQLGIPISYSIGTTISFGPSGKFDPASEYFVYECDEFDRNFLHFQPYVSLITSLDYDHPDTYPTDRDYQTAFSQFIAQSDQTIMWAHDATDVTTPDTTWLLQDNDIPTLRLAGAHNRRNATLVLKAVEYLSPAAEPIAALESFPGTNRRFEKLADNLYSDYGHHPVEIAATLQMARELADQVVLVYQPHQNVRQHEIRDQYVDSVFQNADEIYWLPTYLSREDPNLAVLTPEQLTATLYDSIFHFADLNDELWKEIEKARQDGKLVLCMGAGSIDGWLREQNDIKKVANVLVSDQQGNLILQQRDMNPGINNPGMITGFGGAVEDNETVVKAAARELREETNLVFTDDELTFLTTVFQEKVNDGQPRWVYYFSLKNRDISNLEVFEGAGYAVITPADNLATINLSPTVREAITKYWQ